MSAPEILLLDRDRGVVVVNKPSGLASTGRSLDDPDCVQGWLMATLRRRRVWAVHQLDKDTTGTNLFVLRKALVAELSGRMTSAKKRYLGVCHGALDEAQDVDAAVGTRRDATGRTFPCLSRAGRPAHTRFVPLATSPTATLIEARPTTGRTHQIRLHLHALGHPLIGERLHRATPCDAHPRHALHCVTLGLGLDGGHNVTAPLPGDLSALLAREALSLPRAAG